MKLTYRLVAALYCALLAQFAAAQALVYKQTFNALPAAKVWTSNLQSQKVKDHPENALITAGCGPDGSKCLRIVYRHPDGIHKEPPPSQPFTIVNGQPVWVPASTTTTTTGTDVIQRDLPIDGTTNDLGKTSNPPIPGKAYTLTYDLYFEPGFDFAKGGKLPGLSALDFDSGCTEDGSAKRSPKNWSVRLMWRANGRLELYSYDQSRPSGDCGVRYVIDQQPGEPASEYPGVVPVDGKFRFQPGVWYTLRLSVQVNGNNRVRYKDGQPVQDKLYTDGKLSLLVTDGSASRLLVVPGIPFRDECQGPCPTGAVPDSPESWINAFFFSTFFGGNEVKRLTCNKTATELQLSDDQYRTLCASQDPIRYPTLYPEVSWEPQRPSAIRFDNIRIAPGYVATPTLVP